MKSSLGISPGHITLLKSAPGSSVCANNPPAQPTKINVVCALKAIGKQSKPGDFVYIHYSGHGDRVPTIYSDLKKGPTQDKVLCALEEDIRDIKFGYLLDELVDKGLVVFVVLDCCHSGGASRLSPHTRIRCRRIGNESAKEEEPRQVPTMGDLRNALPVQTRFYRPRGYNLVAACQPHEVAEEWIADDGKVHGAMTFYLLQSLLSLRLSTEPVTYGRLQEVLEAKCKSKLKQQPMHLGDRSRIMFGSDTSTLDSRNLLASVSEINETTVILNKGSANTVCVGDRFRIYHPSQACLGFLHPDALPSAEAIVRTAGELRCQATLLCCESGGLQRPEPGWLAQLSCRAKAAIINFILPEARRQSPVYAAMKRLEQEWHSHAEAPRPLDLQFDTQDQDAELTVKLNENDVFHFQDRAGNQMPHVPAMRADCSFSAKKMALLLRHLHSYQLAATASNPTTYGAPRYRMEIVKDKVEESDTESLAAWRIQFTNLNSRVLYVTILNIRPAYGVHQIFPDDGASSMAVDPLDEIPCLIINIKVPPLLRAPSLEPGFKMRDVIRTFITTEQANFSHYRLCDLCNLDELDEAKTEVQGWTRHAKLIRPPAGSWFTDEREIITVGRTV